MTTTTTPRRTPEVTEAGGKGLRPMWIMLAVVALAAIVAGAVWLIAGDRSDSPAELEATALEELMAQEKTALDPYFADSDPTGYVGIYASEVTYIDPSSGGRLENQAARDYLMSFAGLIPPLQYEILNPSVDLFGDTAIFTFDVEMFDAGTLIGAWNTTEIHQRTSGGWEMVHAHWSNPAPPPEG